METLFSWIHLADLHVRASSAPDKVLASLRQDLAERPLGDQGLPPRPDAILVTGDVAWSGLREEYAAATVWLLDAGRAVGLGPERILVVPGNHDVDRAADKARTAVQLLQDLRRGKKPLDVALERPRDRAPLTKRIKPYLAFAGAFGPAMPGSSPEERLSWAHRIEGPTGLRVRFVGLHSALLSTGDDDRGSLRLGAGQLERAAGAIQPGELAVVLSHHPARGSWLADERAAAAFLEAHAVVHATGHLHEEDDEAARAGTGTSFVWIAAGASPARRKQAAGGSRRLGYSLAAVLVAPDGSLVLRVWPRRWSADKKRFVADDRTVTEAAPFREHALRFTPGEPGSVRSSSLGAPPSVSARAPDPPAAPAPTSPPASSERPPPAPPTLRAPAAAPAPAEPPAPVTFTPPPPAIDPASPPITPAPPAVAPTLPPIAPAIPIAPATGFAAVATFPPAPVAAFVPVTPAPPPVTPAPPPLAPEPQLGRGLFEGPGGLPAHPIHYFLGRGAEIAALRAALTDPGVACVVATGLGGVGKTSLVQQFVATEARALFDEGAWIDARDLPVELGRAAKRFGWRAAERSPTVEEASTFLRAALVDRRVLLVLDNVDPGMADLRLFPIPGGKCRTIITSRIVTLHEDLGKLARPLRLDTWDDATCRAHFREVVRGLADTPDADLDSLARRVGGLPLAVRLLAKQLMRPEVTVARLSERLAREPLGALDGATSGAERSVASTFLASVEGLGLIERRVLVALAACAGATHAAIVAEVAGTGRDDTSMALEGLAEQSLIEWIPDAVRPFRLHEVVSLLLHTQPGAAEAEEVHSAVVRARVEAHRDPRDWQALEGEIPEVLAVVDRRLRAGDPDGACAALADVIGLLDRRGRYGDLVDRCGRILQAAAPDSGTAAAVLTHLGLCWCSLGEVQKAVGCVDRALAIAEDLSWPEGQSLALGALGRCWAALGDMPKALAFHRRAAALHELLDLPILHAHDLGNIGLALRRMGDVAGALEYLEEALEILGALEVFEGQAEVLSGLGLCFRDLGAVPGAIEYFERALRIQEELGRRSGQAGTLGNLGNCFRAIGDLGKGIDHLQRALEIYTDLGLVEGQAAALGNLGSCYRAQGDHARAMEHLQRSLDLLRRVLPEDHPNVKRVLAAMAQREPKSGEGPRRARG